MSQSLSPCKVPSKFSVVQITLTYFLTETALKRAHPTKFVTVTKTRDTNLMLSNEISTTVQMLENATANSKQQNNN